MSLQIVLSLDPLETSGLTSNNVREFLEKCQVRDIVFFDESVSGYVVHEGSLDQETGFVQCEVAILQLNNVEEKDPLNYVNSENKISLTLGKEELVYDNDLIQIWKFEIPVTYPRKRLNNPKLCISCSLVNENNETLVVENESFSEETLANYVPCMKRNLLAELDHQIDFIDTSNDVLETGITVQENSIIDKPNVRAFISVPVTISLVIKLKSTKPAGRNGMLLATLNIESSEEFTKIANNKDYHFDIMDMEVDFKSGSVQPINSIIPIRIQHTDSVNLAYKFNNYEMDFKETTSSRPININLTLRVQRVVNGEFRNVSSIIQTEWSPYLDFGLIAPPINNALKTTINAMQSQSQPTIPINNIRHKALMSNLYKLKGASLSNTNNITSSTTNLRRNRVSLANPSGCTSSVTVNLTMGNNSSLTGLRLTFVGKLDIKLGEVVNWKIQAINNSMSRLNLSLLVQNPINFNPVYSGTNITTNNFSSSNLLNNNGGIRNNDVIIYNRVQLYSLYNSLKVNGDGEGILILNNDIRMGPLDPNAVFETEIQLIGVSKGIFNLDGVKVFDMNSGDGIDFGKLVEVFVI
ncbi:hypothetical protein MEO_00517 [Candida albicans P94015]|nr:hypothetical protein MEO_00517 [Candida albicans P94015]